MRFGNSSCCSVMRQPVRAQRVRVCECVSVCVFFNGPIGSDCNQQRLCGLRRKSCAQTLPLFELEKCDSSALEDEAGVFKCLPLAPVLCGAKAAHMCIKVALSKQILASLTHYYGC